jgi:predicted nuclease of predicted toxin-antitoxin system
MKFLFDQDVYATTVLFLTGMGHEVMTAAQLGLAQASDEELLRVAHEQGRLFVTRDRDFGGLVFVQGSGPGVIYLRILPSTQSSVHAELDRVLTLHSEHDLQESFVVVEPGRHRIRRVGQDQGPGSH